MSTDWEIRSSKYELFVFVNYNYASKGSCYHYLEIKKNLDVYIIGVPQIILIQKIDVRAQSAHNWQFQ